MSQTVLITGATGALGPAVIRALHDAGWNVRTLSRRPPVAGTPAREFPHFAADTGDAKALAEAMRGASVVVHMVALLHVVDPGPNMELEYRRINIGVHAA
ncbi:MAG: NmrA family NAD(P)-binding protein [Dehalococcoidia bacterium]|nr:NmrA family NAD(P)-binding protein [Dehalococcoidia bacterium]